MPYPVCVPNGRYIGNYETTGKNDGGGRSGSFPGSLFILPALLFGGWIAIAVIGGVLGLIGSILGGIFSVLTSVASEAFSGSGVAIGIVMGLALYFWLKKRNTATE